MAFTVQDDNGLVSEANAYADLTYVRGYHADRGLDLTATVDADLQAAIIKGTQYIDTRYVFTGERRNRDQTTEWPRRGAFDRNGYHIEGIPRVIQQAVAELAQRALSGELMPDPTRDETGRTVLSRSDEAGPIKESVKYVGGGAFTFPEYPAVDRLLQTAGLIRSGLTAARS